jgi:hypothetical protein
MSERQDIATLTDDEILTRRVDGGKQAWEAPRLSEMSVGVSAGGASSTQEDDAFDDSAGASGPS